MGAPQSRCCHHGASIEVESLRSVTPLATAVGGRAFAETPAVGSTASVATSTMISRARNVSSAGLHPVALACPELSSCINMIRVEALRELLAPLPRSQDIPAAHFKQPLSNDLVLAVSHGWPCQAHPDPSGTKAEQVRMLLAEAVRAHSTVGDAVCFYDFCSVTQRPFREGQADRTDEEFDRFNRALKCMPRVYLLADAVLHVEMPQQQLPEDTTVVRVDAADLEGVRLVQTGHFLQVWSHGKPKVRLFDVVRTCGGKERPLAEDIESMRRAAKAEGRACPVDLGRSAFGIPNKTPTGDRGWVYLERFVSMVKAAMVDESDFGRVCLSNSPAVLAQIREGSMRLREAARAGEAQLMRELAVFHEELGRKHFGGGSSDKLSGALLGLGLGGAGGPAGQEPAGDREVVAAIMEDMVQALPALWCQETQRQRQRQLMLAVNRGDAPAVEELLRANADVGGADVAGVTNLHRAALYNSLSVAQVLLRWRADVGLQDVEGNCPAHQVWLVKSTRSVEFFTLLAPSLHLLTIKNSRGLSPLDRFQAWTLTADENQPYQPAQEFVERLRTSFPELSVAGSSKEDRTSMLSPRSAALAQHRAREFAVCEEAALVWEWTPETEEVTVDVLWVSCSPVPPSLQRQAADYIGRHLGQSCQARVFALKLVGRHFREPSVASFQEKLLAIIEALPLQRQFVFVLDCVPLAIPLLVRFRARLLGVCLLNIGFCIPDEVFSSDRWNGFKGHCAKLQQAWQQRDSGALAKMYLCTSVMVSSPEEAAGLEAAWRTALEDEGEEHFDLMARETAAMASGDITRALNSMLQPEVADCLEGMPTVLACGALASEAVFIQSMRRLTGLVPGSTLSYIPGSKTAFHLECPGQQLHAVAELLEEFLLGVRGAELGAP